METIEELYEPYNFSATRCYVFTIDVRTKGFERIEHKIPEYVRNLKGIYVSVGGVIVNEGAPKVAGFISLNFNGQSLKCFQMSVTQTFYLNDCSKPALFEEKIEKNSFLQGYYFGYPLNFVLKPEYKISIYLHYTR